MMKSTQATRDALHERLTSALLKNPDSQELKEALDIVEDMLKYHRKMLKNRAVYVLKSEANGKMYFLRSHDMSVMGVHDLREFDDEDGGCVELGILLQEYL